MAKSSLFRLGLKDQTTEKDDAVEVKKEAGIDVPKEKAEVEEVKEEPRRKLSTNSSSTTKLKNAPKNRIAFDFGLLLWMMDMVIDLFRAVVLLFSI